MRMMQVMEGMLSTPGNGNEGQTGREWVENGLENGWEMEDGWKTEHVCKLENGWTIDAQLMNMNGTWIGNSLM